MAEEKKPEVRETRAHKVVSTGSEGVPKKTSTFRKLTRIFLTDDPETALKTMVTNVAIPTFKRGLVDAFSIIVTGKPAFGNGPLSALNDWFNRAPGATGNVPYWQFSGTPTPPPNAIAIEASPTFRDTLWFRDSVAITKVMAEIKQVFDQYHKLRLMDLYDAAGYTGYDWQQAQYWGWTDLTGIITYPESGGFTLKMPPIKNIR